MELKSISIGELRKLQAKIEKEIGNREKRQRSKAMGEIKTIVAKYGLKLDDVVGKAPAAKKPRKSPGKSQKKPAVKAAPIVLYRHPENPELTWGGGRGRRPQWIKDWEAAGKTLDEVRVGQ